MRKSAQKHKKTQRSASTNLARLGKASSEEEPDVHPIQHLQRTIGNQAVLRILRSQRENSDAELPTTEASRFGHDLGIPAYSTGPASENAESTWRPPRADSSSVHTDTKAKVSESGGGVDVPEPSDMLRHAEGGGSGGAGVRAGEGEAAAASSPSASLSITGNGSYADTATESRKNVSFNATWSGGSKEDYIIVNWLKGYMKNSAGTPYKVSMYGSLVDFNFSGWRVDSVDADPAYWSSGGTRWRYSVGGANAFSATDSPGPMNTSDGRGAKARVDFKTAVYKSSDVPTTTTGTISATPLASFQPWTYHVEVLGGGKFKH